MDRMLDIYSDYLIAQISMQQLSAFRSIRSRISHDKLLDFEREGIFF